MTKLMTAKELDAGEGWEKQINLEVFDMSSIYCCVVGQLSGRCFNMFYIGLDSGRGNCISHGLETDEGEFAPENYRRLNRAWRRYFRSKGVKA